jgi:hypothetical protein
MTAPAGSGGGAGLGIDGGLLERFRAAGAKIEWREDTPPPVRPPSARAGAGGPKKPRAAAAPPRVRRAHLHDEEARVEEYAEAPGYRIVTDSGPVGALVLLLEMDRRGRPARIVPHDADVRSKFRQGAIEAVWEDGREDAPVGLPIADLVQLARYALA